MRCQARIDNRNDAVRDQRQFDPVLAQLDGIMVEDGHAVLSLPVDVADAVAAHLAAFGGIEGKLSLLFSEPETEDDERRPGWKP